MSGIVSSKVVRDGVGWTETLASSNTAALDVDAFADGVPHRWFTYPRANVRFSAA